ncbi:MAG: dihydroorotase [Spirochaetales bacterium]|nr:dihydroorotase [Spirochaetales bacterium]
MAEISENKITLKAPDDFHIHLRQAPGLAEYARLTAEAGFARAMVMPNTLPPVTEPAGMAAYKEEIQNAAGPGFTPLMTFKLMPGMTAAQVRALADAGAVAGKYYPAGATTNSSDGLTHWELCADAMGEMERLGMVFSIHGEDPAGPALQREQLFLPRFREMAAAFPELKMVFEHISSAEGTEMVRELPDNVAATVTIHHLLLTQEDILGGALAPHLFCRPLPKSDRDRRAIQDFVLTGSPKVFFGSDSAPHLKEKKECASGAAGIFTSPVALPLLIDFFEEKGRLDLLEAFVSEKGAAFYGLEENTCTVSFVKESWTVPAEYAGVVPFMAEKKLNWRPACVGA